ncbi:MAG: permease [Nanobdellota archaeon]
MKPLVKSLPMMLGVILLISLVNNMFSPGWVASLITEFPIIDSLIGSVFGSIAAGNAVSSYVIAGEYFSVSKAMMTALMVSWVTVGVVQIPAESLMLGKRFAIIRNILAFISCIMITMVMIWV